MTNELIPAKEKDIHIVFVVSVLLKGLSAVFETVLGALLLVTTSVVKLIISLTQNELIQDPNDFIATHIRGALPYLSAHSQLFGAIYLLSHGIIKIFLVWGLLKNKMWAYPTSLVVLEVFIIYQLIRYTYTHSIGLIFLTLFDIFLMWLVWHEYKYLQGLSKTPTVAS